MTQLRMRAGNAEPGKPVIGLPLYSTYLSTLCVTFDWHNLEDSCACLCKEPCILCEESTQRRELLCALEVEHRTDCLFTIRTYRMPYVAMTKTFEAIEATSGRLKIINTLSNLFRSILALTPDDLAKCVYLCLNNVRHVEVFLLHHYSIVCTYVHVYTLTAGGSSI